MQDPGIKYRFFLLFFLALFSMGSFAFGFTTTIQVDSVSCNGNSDGKIVATVSGGTAPYIFTWNTGQKDTTNFPADSLINLPAGNYWVVIDDANASDFHSIEVYEPDPVSIDLQLATDVTCFGAGDGEIDINASGGTPEYYYSIDGGSSYFNNGGHFTGLAPGNYVVSVMDSHRCSVAGDTLTINEPPAITIDTESETDVTCHGGSDGTITVSASGGTSPYVFSIDGGISFQDNGGSFSGLTAGDYQIAVRDANGCVKNGNPVTVNEPPAIGITFLKTDVTCYGGSDGSISITASDGTSPYAFSIDGGTSFQNNGGNYTGLTAGSYNLAVRDADGCVQNGPAVNINEPPQLVIQSQTKTDVTCYGADDGTITLTATGGTPPYTWSVDGGATFQDNGGNYTGLAPGNYDIAVKDSHGCEQNGNTLTINEPTQLVIQSQIKTDVTCHGADDGTITINASGASPPYIYSTDGGTTYMDNGGKFTGLTPGNYDIAVKDSHGCVQNGTTLTITEPAVLDVTTTAVTGVTCHGGSDGAISVTVSGGTPPYGFAWSGPGGFTSVNQDINGLKAGDYYLTVTDANGCTYDHGPVTVNEPDAIGITYVSTDVDCHGGSNGTISITASGGTSPYVFSIDGGASFRNNGGAFTGLVAGSYPLAVRDGNGCTRNGDTVTLIEPPAMQILSLTKKDISCHGLTDGSIDITVSGGTPPWQYSIDGGTTYSEDHLFTGLPAGDYDILIRDANGCLFYGKTLTIIDPPLLLIDSVAHTDVLCAGGNSGTIRIFASGGTETLEYSVNNGTSFYSNNGILDRLPAGSYIPVVQDTNGCTATGPQVVLSEPPALALTIDTIKPSCNSHSFDGTISLQAGGGSGGYFYSIDSGRTFVSGGIFTGLEGGHYYVATRDANGCILIDSVDLIGKINVMAYAGRDTGTCPGTTIQLHASGGDSYQWEPAASLNDPGIPDPVASPGETTNYVVTVTTGVCYDQDTVVVTVFPVHGIDAGRDTVILNGTSVTLTASGEGFVSYLWYPPDGLESNTGRSVVARPDKDIVYYVNGTTQEGCVETDSIKIMLIKEIFIPSGFTPNGDGKNDTWHFGHMEFYPDITVEVFNRWGERVFYSKGYDSSREWNGIYKGKALPSGTYYYVINLNDPKHTPPLTGPVTIMR